jgi:hypothetical protein
MRRWSLGRALAVCAIAAAGCGGGSKSSTPPGGAAKGVYGQYYYLAVAPAAGGTITSGDSTIACQSSGTGCGDSVYHQTKYGWGTQVTLTATALTGYTFQSWGGDCSGTSNVCTLSGTSSATDYSVSAIFSPAASLPATTAGRVYGYVKDGSVGVGGVKLTLGSLSATTNANGAYVFEIAPGSYSLATVASLQYAAAAPVAVNVPVPDGVADPAGSCYLPGAKQGYWVPTAGQVGAGCLVRQADIALTRAGTYVAPATPPTIATTPAMPAVVGFGATVTVGCGVGGTVTQVGTSPTALSLTGPDASGNYSFTTAALGDPAVAAVLATVKDVRPGFVSINQSQAGALTYALTCTLNGASATVKVPMVAAVNANIATAIRGEPFKMASYKGAANGLPGVTGPLWAAGAETTNGGAGNPDGSTWRAHDAVQVPPGVILILDGPANANWKFCKGSKDSFSSCSDPTSTTDKTGAPQTPVAGVPAITGSGAGNAWFPATWKTGTTLYLTSDTLSATNNGFTGEPNIPVKPQIWGSWDQRGKVDATGASIESCAGCHIAPGEKIAWDPTVCPNVPNDGVTPCYELGPTEPTTGWLESKHGRAIIDGASNTHFSLQACGGCHTTGFDNNLPATNVGFSAVLGSYANDFLFEGSDATLFLADLAAKDAAAAALVNVQCTSCHGPTPNNPNHTASMSSKICGTCHNGHDPQYEQWATSKHANLADAISEGPAHGRDQTHCGRCHFGQGYFLYATAIVSGNPDRLGNAAPVGAPTTALVTPLLCSDYAPTAPKAPATWSADACPTTQNTGLVTAQNIDAITCQTCHDPHSLEVRIKDADTANGMLLAGGFKIYNAGSGALCASCHNSRNGIVGATAPNWNSTPVTTSVGGTPTQHNDATPLTSNTTNNFGMTGPHRAAQADVYFAGNGYLLCNGGTASGTCPMPTMANPHQNPSYFADTCAECHVKRLSTATKGTPSNHTFTVDEGTCAGCHGTGTTFIASRKIVVNRMLGEYGTSLTNVLKGAGITLVNGQLNGAVDTSTPPKAVLADYTVASTITKVAVSGDRPLTLDITFSNGDVVASCSIDKIMSGATPVLYSTPGSDKVYGKVAKSMYDFALINNDGSYGVHNIPFVDAMLNAMVNNLDSPGLPK